MKHVVIISADFAPSSLPPALRIRFFANHLSEYGWQPTILTTDPRFYGWPVDPQNENLLPEDLAVIRTTAIPERVARKLGVGDIGMRSMIQHWQAFARLIRRQRVDLVFIPVPPYMPMILGRLIHMRYRIPYVIDYIDPWVTDYYWKLPPDQRPPKWPLANALSRICEPFALRQISHITGVSQGTINEVLRRYPWLMNDAGTDIPYGGEQADFEYLRQHPRPNTIFNRHDGLFHISYIGACIPSMYATVRALFAGVQLGLEQSQTLFERLRLHFVGTSYAVDAGGERPITQLARDAGIEQYVSEQPARVPYLEALQLLIDSHALVVVGTEEAHYTASKIFPYILAHRPLLAIFHAASTVVQFVNETSAGTVLTFTDSTPPQSLVPQITEHLHHLVKLPEDAHPSTNWAAFEPYTTRAMTARLAQRFDLIMKSLI